MEAQIIETLNITHKVGWLPWAVQYFFLIGICYCSFLLSLPGVVFKKPEWKVPSNYALIIMLTCGLIAPVALLADLHQPGRFLNFYLHFQTTSWMSWGSIFLVFYVVWMVIYGFLALQPLLKESAASQHRYSNIAGILALRTQPAQGLIKLAALLAFIGAVLVMVYTGMEVAVIKARPMWNNFAVPIQFALTAMAGAAGAALILNFFTANRSNKAVTMPLVKVVFWAQLAIVAVGGIWLLLGFSGLSPKIAQAMNLLTFINQWELFTIVGVSIIFATLLLAWRFPGNGLLLGLFTVITVWMFRWTVFMGGQEIPKTGAGSYSYTLPWGADGLLGIVGTLGLCIFVYIVITSLVPLKQLELEEN